MLDQAVEEERVRNKVVVREYASDFDDAADPDADGDAL